LTDRQDISMKLMDSIIKFNRIHLGAGGHYGHRPHGPHGRRFRINQSEIYTLFALRSIQLRQNGDGVKVTDLSSALRVSPPTVSQIIRKLSREGYIERQHSEQDRRSVLLSVTEEGDSLCDRLHGRLFERISKLTEHLGEEDSLKMAELLMKTYNFVTALHGHKENEQE
jgi:DNA-binding MarR family transcriptional regulator